MATNPPVQIGELTNVPAPGSGVTSAWCQQVTARIHHRFATPAARTTAFTAPNPLPVKGTVSYLATNDATEGPEYWNGATWRKAWNMPWGLRNYAAKVADTAGMGTTVTDIPGMSVTAANVAGPRVVKVTVWLLMVAAGGGTVYVVDGAAAAVVQGSVPAVTGVGQIVALTAFYTVPAGVSSVTFKARAAAAGGTLNILGNAAYPGVIAVQDVGPAVGAPT